YVVPALAEHFRPLRLLITPVTQWSSGTRSGGTVASAFLPVLKSSRPVRDVLANPPLEPTPTSVALSTRIYRRRYQEPKDARRREDGIIGSLSVRPVFRRRSRSLSFSVVGAYDENVPWSFSHQLSPGLNVHVTQLAADPA
ncbi:hypothetical protein V8E55_010756, partial [Tylopilus felleus]